MLQYAYCLSSILNLILSEMDSFFPFFKKSSIVELILQFFLKSMILTC